MSEPIRGAWRLVFALDDAAAALGWLPAGRTTADDEVTVVYRRAGRPTSGADQIPAMVEALPFPEPADPPIEDH